MRGSQRDPKDRPITSGCGVQGQEHEQPLPLRRTRREPFLCAVYCWGLLLRRGLFGAFQEYAGSEKANGKQPTWEIEFRYGHRKHNQNRHHDDGAYTGKTHKVSFRTAA